MTYFPAFLFQRGRVTSTDIIQSVLQQRAARPRLGELALEKGKLTNQSLQQLVALRERSTGRFGEIAIRMGMLTQNDVAELLAEQRELEPDLTDILLKKGSLDSDAVEAERAALRAQETDAPERARKAASSWAVTIASLSQLKPFSTAVRQAMQLLDDPGVAPTAIGKALARDPVMAISTLRLANSAMYRRGAPCETLAEAVTRLGIRNVRHMVVGLSLLGAFTHRDRSALVVRNHSAGVAALCRVVASMVAPRKANEAFLTGLTHDVGKLLLIQSGEFSYADLQHAILDTPGRVREAEAAELGFDHSILAQLALSLWNLSTNITAAVGLHHDTERSRTQSDDIAVLTSIVALCDRIDYHQRFSPQFTSAVASDIAQCPDAAHLGLAPSHVEEVWVELVAARAESIGVLSQ